MSIQWPTTGSRILTLTKLGLTAQPLEQRSVLSNTLLVGTMVVQAGLNASTLSWRALVYDFLDDLRRLLGTGADDYKRSFIKLAKMNEESIRLCAAPSRPNDGQKDV